MATARIIYAVLLVALTVSAAPTGDSTSTDTVAGLCGGKPADIVFLLDASSSIWGPNFMKQLRFVHDVVDKFDVSDAVTHVAAMTFSDRVHEEFGLRTFGDMDGGGGGGGGALNAIPVVQQLYGGTRTDLALRRARHMMRQDGRRDVPRLVIVMTDGKSDLPESTMVEAMLLRQAGITTFTIGIGQSVDRDELVAIASREEYVFSVDSFDALETLKSILAYETCQLEVLPAGDGDDDDDREGQEEGDNRVDHSDELTKGCDGKPADVVFALDASSSIWQPDFERQLSFVQDLVSVFEVSPQITRIGVLSFGKEPQKAFYLDQYANETDVRAAIGRIEQSRGDTNTADALHAMRRHFFSDKHARQGVVQIGLIITDGLSNDPVATAHQAELTRQHGIHLFAIGVGQAADRQELEDIANKPSDQYVFTVNNYAALKSVKQLLAMKTCQVTLPPTPPPTTTPTTTTTLPPGCGAHRPADVVFAMPSGADRREARKVLQMIAGVTEESDVGQEAVRLGLVPKDCFDVPGFQLRQTLNKQQVLAKIDGRYAAATRGTAHIVRYMRKNAFRESNGARPAASKVGVIVVAASSPGKSEQTVAEASKAMNDRGIKFIVIRVGDGTSEDEAEAVAGGSKRRVISVASYEELPSLAPRIVERLNDICNEAA